MARVEGIDFSRDLHGHSNHLQTNYTPCLSRQSLPLSLLDTTPASSIFADSPLTVFPIRSAFIYDVKLTYPTPV
jgi:hypothetical protein